MTLLEHLGELRDRLIKMVLALVIATAVSFMFTDRLFTFLLRPVNAIPLETTPVATPIVLTEDWVITTTLRLLPGPAEGIAPAGTAISATVLFPAGTILPVQIGVPREGIRPIFLKPTEMFFTYFWVALLAGVALSLPVLLYQIVAFIAPGLKPGEKRALYFLLPATLVFFVIGVLFAYFFMLPFALRYLLTFGGSMVQAMPSIGEYIAFVTTLLFWVGMAFETPLIVLILARLGIVNVKKLTSFRRYAYLLAFVIAAVITPTPDPVNQVMVAVPIILLYEIGIILARIAGRPRPQSA